MAIKVNKKLIALETLILTISISVCSVIYFVGEHYNDIEYSERRNAKQNIESQIDSLRNNHFFLRYKYLKYNNEPFIKEYSYESYKKKILNDKDSSFRRDLYYYMCRYEPTYRNDIPLEKFINDFENDSIEKIDEKIFHLEGKLKFTSNQPHRINISYISIIQIFLFIFYPIRYLFQIAYWSIKTLSKNENN